MGELETTGGTGGPGGGDFDPPRGDEGLDDWLARRLEAQGIVANRPGFPTARILAVLGLVAALLALFWVISGTGGELDDRDATGHAPDGDDRDDRDRRQHAGRRQEAAPRSTGGRSRSRS